jgi:PHD/YefM family antitoxin component YafN of YafNO toxin-antitoxin module
LEREHGRVIITKHGRPAVVLLSIEDLESLEETLEVLGDRRLIEDLREAEAEVQAGTSAPMTKEQALASIKDR